MKSVIFLLLAFIGATLAYGHHDPSDDIHRMKDLELQKIFGKWYILSYIRTSINDTEHADLDCMEERIEQNKDNQFLMDFNLKMFIKSTKKYSTIKGLGAITDPKHPEVQTAFMMNKVAHGIIVGTDYTNFLVVANHGEPYQKPIYWLMSRTESLDPTVTSTIFSFLGFDQSHVKSYDFSKCPKMVQSNAVDVEGDKEDKPAE